MNKESIKNFVKNYMLVHFFDNDKVLMKRMLEKDFVMYIKKLNEEVQETLIDSSFNKTNFKFNEKLLIEENASLTEENHNLHRLISKLQNNKEIPEEPRKLSFYEKLLLVLGVR
jgi:hypothetical protein